MRNATSRASWTVADHVLSSLSNFALSALVARGSSPETFGRFTLVFTLYLLALGVSRALGAEPLLSRFSAAFRWEAGAAVTGLAVALGAAAAVALGLAAALAPAGVRELLVALALILPGLLLQDAWRYVFFAEGQPRRAMLNDLVWLLSQAVVFSLLVLSHRTDALALCLGWGATGGLAAIFGCLQARLLPRPRAAWRWIREQRDLAVRFLAESMALVGSGQLVVYGVGASAGLAALGALRSGQIVFGPVQMLLTATLAVAIPEGSRLVRSHPRAVPIAYACLVLSLVGACAAWGIVVVALPDPWGLALLRDNWTASQSVLPGLAVSMALAAVGVAALVLLRIRGAARQSSRARLLAAALHPIGATIGAAVGDARGAVVGLAVVNAILAVFWSTFASTELRSIARSVPNSVKGAETSA